MTAPMLYNAHPGRWGECRYARYGCRCGWYPESHSRHAAHIRRRRNRATETRLWRREELLHTQSMFTEYADE